MQSKSGFNSKILIAFLCLVIAFVGLSFWLISGNLDPLKIKFLKVFPLPIAFVEEQPVFFQDFLELQTKTPSSFQKTDAQIYQALLENKKYALLCQKYCLSKELPLAKNVSLYEEAQNYKDGLKFYYNSNTTLNSENLKLANDIKNRLNAGESFESLSFVYNKDDFSKTFSGLTGEINKDEILPELLNPLKKSEDKTPIILPSRLGIHIIEIQNQTEQSISVKQIFLPSYGFDKWLSEEMSKIKIKTIIKF